MSDVDWEQYAKPRSLGRNRLVSEHHQQTVLDFLNFFADRPVDLKVLDIGCSAGFFLVLLRELGFNDIQGFDASENFCRQAQAKGLQCQVRDITDGLEDPERIYDVVLLMDIIEHLPEPGEVLQKIRKSFLKPDGLLYTTVPIYDSLTDKYMRLKNRQTKLEQSQKHDPTHVQAFSEKSFKELVSQSGFKVIESKRLYCQLPKKVPKGIRNLVKQVLPSKLKGKFLRVVARPEESKEHK